MIHAIKHLSRNEMPCQVVFNKMSLHPITGELKDFKKLEKKLISKIIILKKKKEAIIHRKGEFVKVKGGICNIPVETANICNILPRTAGSNRLLKVLLVKYI